MHDSAKQAVETLFKYITKIEPYSRITAVADVFDTLGSDRCYKRA